MERRELDSAEGSLQIKPSSRGHQVVPAAAGAKLTCERPDFTFQPPFDPRMHVFRRAPAGPIRMRPNIAPNGLEAPQEPARFARLEHANPAKLPDIGGIGGEVMLHEPAVHRERFREFFE